MAKQNNLYRCQAHCGIKLQPEAFGFGSRESLILDMKGSIEMTYKGQGTFKGQGQ